MLKKIWPVLLIALFCCGVYAAEATPVSPAGADVGASAASPTMDYVKHIGIMVLAWLQVPIAVLFTGLFGALIAIVAKKFKISLSADNMALIQNGAKIAVDRAEQWALNYAATHDTKPSGQAKLDVAVTALGDLLASTSGQKFSNETLTHYIEAHIALLNGVNSPSLDSQAATDPVLTAAHTEATEANTKQTKVEVAVRANEKGLDLSKTPDPITNQTLNKEVTTSNTGG